MALMRSPRRRASRAQTWLPISSVSKYGISSLAKATKRAGSAVRASSISTATPEALSSAPGQPGTLS
jgi:hypothetical protein